MERIYTFNLAKACRKPVVKRAKRAVSLLRALVARHSKMPLENVFIDETVNALIWSHGAKHPLKAIKVRVLTDDKGVHVMLPEAKEKEVKPAQPAKTTKAPAPAVVEKKEQVKPEKPKEQKKA
jgi:large subunit ribosomal protein L31e